MSSALLSPSPSRDRSIWITSFPGPLDYFGTPPRQQVELALRTGLACALSATYAVLKVVGESQWQALGALAPVFAIVAVNGPTIGATLLVSRSVVRGAVWGGAGATAVVEVVRHAAGALAFSSGVRTALAGVGFYAVTFICVSRESLNLTEKKVTHASHDVARTHHTQQTRPRGR